MIVTWANNIGAAALIELLEDLEGAGHLASKPQGYVHKAVLNKAKARQATGVDDTRMRQAAALEGGARRRA